MKITIAIITRDRSESLAQTLNAIVKQKYENKEIIVIDNASIDNTKEIIERFHCKYFYSPKYYGFSKTRQIAVENATGELILWCDDDCIPNEYWANYFVNEFEKNEKLALAAGKINNIGFSHLKKYKGTQIISTNGLLIPVEDPNKAIVYSNLNLAMRKSSIIKIGGYDPFFIGGYEEIDLNIRIRKAGYEVAYVSLAYVDHYHRFTSFKRGRLFYSGTLMRLYFFLKHKKYLNLNFSIIKEIYILINEIKYNLKTILLGIYKFEYTFFQIGFVELFNSLFARVCLPYLIIKSKINKYL